MNEGREKMEERGKEGRNRIYKRNEGRETQADLGNLHLIICGICARGKTVWGYNFLHLF